MGDTENTPKKPADSDGIQKQYNHYEQESVVINSREEFEKFKGHKLKKTWYNERNRRCLESFLYLFTEKGKDGESDQYVYLEIKKGEAQQDRMKAPIEDLFKQNVVVFAGYVPNEKLDEIFRLRSQGVSY